MRKAPSPRAPLTLAPRSALAPASSDSWAQKKAQAQLERACAKIIAAPCGAQDSTRHAQCFYIGGLIARGDLGYEEAYAALLEAACAMPVHRDPWRNLDARVARSIESGMERPLALSETEQWVRNFRARNLWPEPRRSIEPTWNAEAKDRLEARLRELVCDGSLDVREAQRAIADDRTEAYGRLIGVK